MSRSMTPPDTLSNEQVYTVAKVRRDIWTNAVYGMGVGAASGAVLHTIAAMGQRRNLWKVFSTTTATISTRNTSLMAFVMVGTCLGSFIGATTEGQNRVHELHPIFSVGARPPIKAGGETYEEALERAQSRENELMTLERRKQLHQWNHQESQILSDEEDRLLRERNRMYRRATLHQKLDGKHGGLNDSRGGHWVDETNGNTGK